jgi:hypothetical protein
MMAIGVCEMMRWDGMGWDGRGAQGWVRRTCLGELRPAFALYLRFIVRVPGFSSFLVCLSTNLLAA